MTKKLTSTICLLLFALFASATDIRGTVKDSETKEPLIGASVQIAGTTIGTITDLDGTFILPGVDGERTITVSYVSYVTETLTVDPTKDDEPIEVMLSPDNRQLGEVMVTARKNNETATALLKERQKSTIPIENIGARDLSVKGISDVQEGVKKLTGISVASSGQIIVRGLGDRYSITTLNGMSVASPNPDNKLIPLDLFPTSTVKNITVSKVYDAATFADYSGAHIDIATKDQTSDNFFEASFALKGYANTLGGDFYEMDRASTLFRNPSIDERAFDKGMKTTDFREFSKANKIFNTGFNVERRTAIPAFSGNASFGRNIRLGSNDLNILASLSISNSLSSMDNAMVKTLNAVGETNDYYDYDAYINELKVAGLASVGYSFTYGDQCFVIATDLGYINKEAANHIAKADYLVIEANYDETMLKNGPYPYPLKQRVRSHVGHLSNEHTARFLADNPSGRLTHVFLCHLSQENNTPETARRAVTEALAEKGITLEMVQPLERMQPSQVYMFRHYRPE